MKQQHKGTFKIDYLKYEIEIFNCLGITYAKTHFPFILNENQFISKVIPLSPEQWRQCRHPLFTEETTLQRGALGK